jgi:hypothetical protein
MSNVTRLVAAGALAAMSAFTLGAHAHDHWLELEPFVAKEPGKAKVYLQLGEHFTEAQPLVVRDKNRFLKLEIIGGGGRKDATADLREDNAPLAILSASKASGTFIVALSSAPRTLELDSKKFSEYLLEERLVDILSARASQGSEDAPARERYTRFLKALHQVGAQQDAIVTQPVGHDLEIVPETNPYAVQPGGSLTVQVLFKGKPLPGRAVMAANRLHGHVTTKWLRTDDKGKARFTLSRAGDHMIRLVHMEASTERDVDYRSYWANMTFSLPEPVAEPKK